MLSAIRKGEVMEPFTTNGYAGKDAISGAYRGNAILVPDKQNNLLASRSFAGRLG